MNELSTTDALTPTERLRLLKDQMHKYKLNIEEILENFEKESPKIIKENLNLILSLLSNCKSHIDIKINQNKHKDLKIKKIKKTKTKSNIKIEDKNKEFEEKSVKINYECDKEKSFNENCNIDEIKDDIEDNVTAENLDDPLFQHEGMIHVTLKTI